MSKYTGAVISDIHIGIENTNLLQEELKSIFLDKLESMKKLNFIIIAGDYFDDKLYANDYATDVALYIMTRIINICKRFNAKLRIVYGTESHENDQYILFNHLVNDIDYKVIKTVEDEQLFEDLKVLYVPEEYIEEKGEYYREYLNRKDEYNYIFGHGSIVNLMKGINPIKTKEELTLLKNEINYRRATPYFNPSELAYICKGQVYFGHYHVNTSLDNKIFYCGSFSRWCFGEDEDKGFYIINADTNKEKYTNKFVINTMCEVYKTLVYSQDDLKDTDMVMKVFDKIAKLADDKIYPHLKVKLDIPRFIGLNEVVNDIVSTLYYRSKSVKFEYDHGYVTKEKYEKDIAFKEEYEKYKYILDKSLSIPEKIHMYINLEFDANMSLEDVNRWIYDDVIKELKEHHEERKKDTTII